jgi:peptidyl-prolyl cis-trans isomerase C
VSDRGITFGLIKKQGVLPMNVLKRLRKILPGNIFLVFVTLFFLVSSNSWPQTEADNTSPVIAKVGQWQINFQDIERIVRYYPKNVQEALLQDPQKMMKMINRMVEAKVLSDKAKAEGFDEEPAIAEQLDIFFNDKLAVAYMQERVLKDISVTDEELKQYYQANREKYELPEQVRVRHILFRVPIQPTEIQVEEAKKKALDCLSSLKEGDDFNDVASSVSEDLKSRQKGGDLGWVSAQGLDPAFAKAVFSASKGELSGPVRSNYGFHIFLVEDKRSEKQLSFQSVRGRVEQDLLKEMRSAKGAQFLDKALEESGAVIDQKKLIDLMLKEN